MSKKKACVFVLAAALAPFAANAAEVHVSVITNVRIRPDTVYFKLASCSNYARIFLPNDSSKDYYKSMVALVLSAAASGTKVQVQLNDSCQITEPTVAYVDAIYN